VEHKGGWRDVVTRGGRVPLQSRPTDGGWGQRGRLLDGGKEGVGVTISCTEAST
jgi:hypothetical protein